MLNKRDAKYPRIYKEKQMTTTTGNVLEPTHLLSRSGVSSPSPISAHAIQ